MTNQIPHDLAESGRLKNLLVQLSTENSTDILEDLVVLGDRPEVLSLLMYKLAEEKTKTNKLLEDLNAKYDDLLERIEKVDVHHSPYDYDKNILPSQDQAIFDLIKQNGHVSAEEVKDALNYKGLNAASQRLNKLYKENVLDKKRVGQKVVYLLK